MTEQTTKEQTASDRAENAIRAEVVANKPVRTTLDLVKEKFAEAKKGTAVASQAGDAPAEAVSAKVDEKPRAADGKFDKSDETKSKEKDDREVRALNALRRAKVSTSIIEKLSDEDRIQMGLELADQQSKVDKQFSENGKQAESRKEPEKGQPKADDLSKRDKALAESLAVDEDAIKGLDERTVAVVRPLLEQVESANEALLDQMANIALDAVMTRLVGEFPELSVSDVRSKVVARAHKLADSVEFDDGADVMSEVERIARDAVWLECRDSIKARRSDAEKANSKAKAAGQPVLSSRQSDAGLPVGATTLDKLTAYKMQRDSGASHDQALAAMKTRN